MKLRLPLLFSAEREMQIQRDNGTEVAHVVKQLFQKICKSGFPQHDDAVTSQYSDLRAIPEISEEDEALLRKKGERVPCMISVKLQKITEVPVQMTLDIRLQEINSGNEVAYRTFVFNPPGVDSPDNSYVTASVFTNSDWEGVGIGSTLFNLQKEVSEVFRSFLPKASQSDEITFIVQDNSSGWTAKKIDLLEKSKWVISSDRRFARKNF